MKITLLNLILIINQTLTMDLPESQKENDQKPKNSWIKKTLHIGRFTIGTYVLVSELQTFFNSKNTPVNSETWLNELLNLKDEKKWLGIISIDLGIFGGIKISEKIRQMIIEHIIKKEIKYLFRSLPRTPQSIKETIYTLLINLKIKEKN